MNTRRAIKSTFTSKPTLEGAGVHLKRAFGFFEVELFDPFLLLDDFRSENPEHYVKGFPWHPHRGMETISYVLHGEVEHGDSMGNKGIIASGDVQWMTAGSGIVHQEMPRGDGSKRMHGFQLWANLPASRKMMAPRYQEVASDTIPEVVLESGAKVRVIAGRVGETAGPVREIVIDPELLDVTLPARSELTHPTKRGHTVIVYVIDGRGRFSDQKNALDGNETLLLFEDGDEITVSAEAETVRFLLFSGKPINEPVAWQGPIVMNTQEELRVAFEEYEKGTFIKSR